MVVRIAKNLFFCFGLLLGMLILLIEISPSTIATTPFYNESFSRFPINCSLIQSDGFPILINGSQGLMIGGRRQYIWTSCWQSDPISLYYLNSSNYYVANTTSKIPMEVDLGNGTSYNITAVWHDFYLAVYHMNDRNDSVHTYDWSAFSGFAMPAKVDGIIGNAYLFTDSNIQFPIPNLGDTYNIMQFFNSSGASSDNYAGYIYYDASGTSGDDHGLIQSGDANTFRAMMGSGVCDREFTYTPADSKAKMLSIVGTGTNQIIYSNNTAISSIACTHVWDGMTEGTLVGHGEVDRPRAIDGIFDEIRFSESALLGAIGSAMNDTWYNYKNTEGWGNTLLRENYTASPPVDVLAYWNNESVSQLVINSTGYYNLEINKSNWLSSTVLARLIWNNTKYLTDKVGTGNWTFNATVQIPATSAGKTIEYFWLINASSPAINRTNNVTINYSQSIVTAGFGICEGLLNNPVLAINVLDENNFKFLSGTRIYGNYRFWNLDHGGSRATDSFNGTFDYYQGINLSTTNNTENVNGSGSTATHSTIDFKFTPYVPSIISEITWVLNATPTNFSFHVRLNNCSEGTELLNYTLLETASSDGFLYLGASNYTSASILLADTQYCIRMNTSIGGIFQTSLPLTETNSIFGFSSQNLWHNYQNVWEYGLKNSLKLTEVSQSDKKFCIFPSTPSYGVDMEIYYQTAVLEKYYLLNATLAYIGGAITSLNLFGINDTTGYETAKVSLVDLSYNPMQGLYTKMLRWYPSQNMWKLVQMDKSDDIGNNYFNVLERTTDYKFLIQTYDEALKETSLLKFFKPYAGDILTTINVNTLHSEAGLFSGYNYTYNSTSKDFVFYWNDISGVSQSINLIAYSDATVGIYEWCDMNATTSAGSLLCNLNLSTGSVRIQVFRITGDSDDLILGTSLSSIAKDLYDAFDGKGLGKDALLWVAIICGIIIMAGAYNPLTLIISIPIALIFMSLLGLSNYITTVMFIGALILAVVLGIVVKRW
jgi:hypothetical protein